MRSSILLPQGWRMRSSGSTPWGRRMRSSIPLRRGWRMRNFGPTPPQGSPRRQGGARGTSHAACAWSPHSVLMTPAAPAGTSAASESAGFAAPLRHKVQHCSTATGSTSVLGQPRPFSPVPVTCAIPIALEQFSVCCWQPPAHSPKGWHGVCGGVWDGASDGVQPKAVEESGRGRGRCPQHRWCSLTSAPCHNTAEKPGACPAAAPEGLFYPCSFPCLEDRDCLGMQKCCALGCGSACLEPVQGKAQGSGTAPAHRCVSAGPGRAVATSPPPLVTCPFPFTASAWTTVRGHRAPARAGTCWDAAASPPLCSSRPTQAQGVPHGAARAGERVPGAVLQRQRLPRRSEVLQWQLRGAVPAPSPGR